MNLCNLCEIGLGVSYEIISNHGLEGMLSVYAIVVNVTTTAFTVGIQSISMHQLLDWSIRYLEIHNIAWYTFRSVIAATYALHHHNQGITSYVHATLHEVFCSNNTIVATLVPGLGIGAGIEMDWLVDRLSSINTERSISIMNSITTFRKA